MAAARSLSTEVNEDAELAALSDGAARLYLQAIALADDHGNLPLDPEWMRARIFWRSTKDTAAVARLIEEIAGTPLWQIYEEKGRQYAHYRSWQKHQRIQIPRRPKHPLPPGWTCVEVAMGRGSKWVSSPPQTESVTDANDRINGRINDPLNETATTINHPPSTPTSLLSKGSAEGEDSSPRVSVQDPTPVDELEPVFAAVPGGNAKRLCAAFRSLEAAKGRPTRWSALQVAQTAVAEFLSAASGNREFRDPGPYLSKIVTRLLSPGEMDKAQRAGSGSEDRTTIGAAKREVERW
jgi:hypothetical protein